VASPASTTKTSAYGVPVHFRTCSRRRVHEDQRKGTDP
jgi:hypothetical protein